MTTTFITATIPIYPEKQSEEQLLFNMAAGYRAIKNHYSQRLYQTFGQRVPKAKWFKKSPKLHKDGYMIPGYAKLRKTLNFEVKALPIQQSGMFRVSALSDVLTQYEIVNANKHHIKKPIKFDRIECALIWNDDIKQAIKPLNKKIKPHMQYQTDRFDQFDISIPGKHGKWVTVNAQIHQWQDDLLSKAHKFGTSRLYYREFNKQWYLAIPVEVEATEPTEHIHTVVGMNLGINHVATLQDTNNNISFMSGQHIKHRKRENIKRAYTLQKKQTRSAKRKLKAIGNRENRWQKDINHTITKQLNINYGAGTLFIMEDLMNNGLQKALQNVPREHRRLQKSWAYAQFRSFMEYKSLLYGTEILFVSPENVSITCSKCGYQHKSNRTYSPDQFKCRNCDYTVNQDLNAARNVLVRGLTKAVEENIIQPNQFNYPVASDGVILDGITRSWSDKQTQTKTKK